MSSLGGPTFKKNVFFLEMGYPNLRVELKRALKTGIKDLYTCTRTPPVDSFERESWLTELPNF